MPQNNAAPLSARQSEDLQFFEERLKCNLSSVAPRALKWKVVFILVVCWVLVSLWRWWQHFDFERDQIFPSLASEISLILSLIVLVLLLLLGAHHRSREPGIIAGRIRRVLRDYNMYIDDVGRLILLPSTSRAINGR